MAEEETEWSRKTARVFTLNFVSASLIAAPMRYFMAVSGMLAQVQGLVLDSLIWGLGWGSVAAGLYLNRRFDLVKIPFLQKAIEHATGIDIRKDEAIHLMGCKR